MLTQQKIDESAAFASKQLLAFGTADACYAYHVIVLLIGLIEPFTCRNRFRKVVYC